MSSYVLNVAPGDMQWLKTPKREWYRTACAVLVFAAAVDTESDNISGDHKINRVDCRSKETTFPEWVVRAKGLQQRGLQLGREMVPPATTCSEERTET